MARVVKAPAVRRTEILDAAERLLADRGYDGTTVQDVLDELGISKGAFYHYFDSKLALLSAVIERSQADMAQALLPLVDEPGTPALDKLREFFALLLRGKAARKDLALALLRAWYTEENAVVRQRAQAGALERLGPALERVIDQGIREGALAVAAADGLGRVVLVLAHDLSDVVAAQVLAERPQPLEPLVAAHTAAIERAVGAPPGTLRVFDGPALREWTGAAPEP
jgi:AcrR family transcriptional regulator